MHYQRLRDDASLIINENGETQLHSSTLDTDRNICHLRKRILIFLLIQLGLSICLSIMDACLLYKDKDEHYRQGIRSLAPIFLSFIYYGFGLYTVYRYGHSGIRTFAWLGILQYISLCAEVYLNIIFSIKHPAHDTRTKLGIRISFMITILSICQTILLVMTLKFTFKLLRLIKSFKREIAEQI